MRERDFIAEARALIAQGRRRTPDAPSEITDVDFLEIQQWLSYTLRVTRQQIAEAFRGYESTRKKKPHWSRGTWQGRRVSPDCASVKLTDRGKLSDLSYEVRTSTADGTKVPYVTLPNESLTDAMDVSQGGMVGKHRITGEGVPEGEPQEDE